MEKRKYKEEWLTSEESENSHPLWCLPSISALPALIKETESPTMEIPERDFPARRCVHWQPGARKHRKATGARGPDSAQIPFTCSHPVAFGKTRGRLGWRPDCCRLPHFLSDLLQVQTPCWQGGLWVPSVWPALPLLIPVPVSRAPSISRASD